MSKENPVSFNDLTVDELLRTAVEDFAVDVKKGDSKKTIIAALVEDGVEWSQYAALKGLNAPEPEAPVAEEAPVVAKEEAPVEIVTYQPPAPEQKYLIKMDRKNPLFEILGHRFTQEHPYALVTGEEAEHLVTKEEGFRMAYPSELEEFYK